MHTTALGDIVDPMSNIEFAVVCLVVLLIIYILATLLDALWPRRGRW